MDSMPLVQYKSMFSEKRPDYSQALVVYKTKGQKLREIKELSGEILAVAERERDPSYMKQLIQLETLAMNVKMQPTVREARVMAREMMKQKQEERKRKKNEAFQLIEAKKKADAILIELLEDDFLDDKPSEKSKSKSKTATKTKKAAKRGRKN
jgi:hypothetical protein